jgi:hypothetical protein
MRLGLGDGRGGLGGNVVAGAAAGAGGNSNGVHEALEARLNSLGGCLGGLTFHPSRHVHAARGLILLPVELAAGDLGVGAVSREVVVHDPRRRALGDGQADLGHAAVLGGRAGGARDVVGGERSIVTNNGALERLGIGNGQEDVDGGLSNNDAGEGGKEE